MSDLAGKIANFMHYISVVEENQKMLKTTLNKSLSSLKGDRRYKNLDEDLRDKKKSLIEAVQQLLSSTSSDQTGNSQFLQIFSDKSIEELKEYCDECKQNTHSCKKLIKDLEDFYSEIKHMQE
jgi:hypothetical protein